MSRRLVSLFLFLVACVGLSQESSTLDPLQIDGLKVKTKIAWTDATDRPVFQEIAPCILVDTRTASNFEAPYAGPVFKTGDTRSYNLGAGIPSSNPCSIDKRRLVDSDAQPIPTGLVGAALGIYVYNQTENVAGIVVAGMPNASNQGQMSFFYGWTGLGNAQGHDGIVRTVNDSFNLSIIDGGTHRTDTADVVVMVLGWFVSDPGAQGPSGAQGPPGATGSQGQVGPKGDQGVAGDRGLQGNVGQKGDVGPAGPQGLKGDQGAKGDSIKGDKGEQGPVGATGPAGQRGEAGQPGSQGSVGPAGPSGPQGNQGQQGVAGVPGPAGQQGAKGDQGPAGPVGPASTVPGPQGPAGSQGPKGDKGDVGPASTVPGPPGATGPQGVPGPTGPASTVPGPKGDTGSTGPQGPAGPASTVPGPQGPVGPAGSPGAQGSPGPVGPQGAPGKDGKDATVCLLLTKIQDCTKTCDSYEMFKMCVDALTCHDVTPPVVVTQRGHAEVTH